MAKKDFVAEQKEWRAGARAAGVTAPQRRRPPARPRRRRYGRKCIFCNIFVGAPGGVYSPTAPAGTCKYWRPAEQRLPQLLASEGEQTQKKTCLFRPRAAAGGPW